MAAAAAVEDLRFPCPESPKLNPVAPLSVYLLLSAATAPGNAISQDRRRPSPPPPLFLSRGRRKGVLPLAPSLFLPVTSSSSFTTQPRNQQAHQPICYSSSLKDPSMPSREFFLILKDFIEISNTRYRNEAVVAPMYAL